MFANQTDLPSVTPDNMYISRKEPEIEIPVYFVEKTLTLEVVNEDQGTKFESVTLSVGIIDESYNTNKYFDWPKQNVIGLAPSIPDNPTSEEGIKLLKRQFLY